MRKAEIEKLTNVQIAAKWWAFRRLRPSQGEEGYLPTQTIKAILDVVVERLARAVHERDKARAENASERDAVIDALKDLIEIMEDS